MEFSQDLINELKEIPSITSVKIGEDGKSINFKFDYSKLNFMRISTGKKFTANSLFATISKTFKKHGLEYKSSGGGGGSVGYQF